MLALMIVTMGIMALVAITFGQAVVRRQQAQMVVDAAAFAGAAEQAKGLNTIARINEKQINLINGIIFAQAKGLVFGYKDSAGTTLKRILCFPPIVCGGDWSSDNWYEYEKTFETLNQSARAVNIAYGTIPGVPLKPSRAASKVVADNFGSGSGRIFANEAPVSHGPIVWLTELPSAAQLVRLTQPKEYAVGNGRRYTPNSSTINGYCSLLLFPPAIKACKAYQNAKWIPINAWYNLDLLRGVPKYRAGQFYDNAKGRDVRFCYYLRIQGPKPLVGKSWFGDVPDMVVIASAKPYGGYLGDEFEENFPWLLQRFQHFGYSQQEGKEIAYTYRARLIPVRTLEKRQLALQVEGANALDPAVFAKYLSIVH